MKGSSLKWPRFPASSGPYFSLHARGACICDTVDCSYASFGAKRRRRVLFQEPLATTGPPQQNCPAREALASSGWKSIGQEQCGLLEWRNCRSKCASNCRMRAKRAAVAMPAALSVKSGSFERLRVRMRRRYRQRNSHKR